MYKLCILPVLYLAYACSTATTSVSPSVARALENHGTVNIVINFRQKTSTILKVVNQQSFGSRGDRINTVADSLRKLAASSQESVLAYLTTQEVTATTLWISNQIAVKAATAEVVAQLVKFHEIESIVEDKVVLAPIPDSPQRQPIAPSQEIQWGVEMVGAPAAWAKGYTGNGVVVGMLDTGVRHTHNVLRSNYRQDHGWYDASEVASPTPIDTGFGAGHGTHVMGSIVGVNGVGVAPEAKWIACRSAMLYTSISELQRCGEFFLCPTHSDGSDPDCNMAPHVISHSWGFYPDEDHDFFDATILAWNAAGIIVVFANGNEGTSGCGNTRYPSNGGFDMFTVGATTSDDLHAYFSSFGPGSWTGALSPNIAAPGDLIVSASHEDDESLKAESGTSMAAPHVAGVIALLLTNGTELSYQDLSCFVFESAEPLSSGSGRDCGGISESNYPNNAVGYGRISASGAVARLLESRNQNK